MYHTSRKGLYSCHNLIKPVKCLVSITVTKSMHHQKLNNTTAFNLNLTAEICQSKNPIQRDFTIEKLKVTNRSSTNTQITHSANILQFKIQHPLSNKVSNIHRHFVDLGTVILLNVSQNPDIILTHKIYRHTLHQ